MIAPTSRAGASTPDAGHSLLQGGHPATQLTSRGQKRAALNGSRLATPAVHTDLDVDEMMKWRVAATWQAQRVYSGVKRLPPALCVHACVHACVCTRVCAWACVWSAVIWANASRS